MIESAVESGHCRKIKAKGGEAYKFVSPAHRGVPDRLVLFPIPQECRAIVARYVKFIEFKRPGAKPTPQQVREHERLRAMGFTVEVIDS